MAYWLVKSEPFKYSWAQMVADGRTHWDGVRNYQAANNLKAMQVGDRAFFYHSNEGKEIVGVARVSRAAYQDPTTTEDWSVVDFEPVKALAQPVTLAAIREMPKLKDMALLKKSRLSVGPVTKPEFDAILRSSKTKL